MLCELYAKSVLTCSRSIGKYPFKTSRRNDITPQPFHTTHKLIGTSLIESHSGSFARISSNSYYWIETPAWASSLGVKECHERRRLREVRAERARKVNGHVAYLFAFFLLLSLLFETSSF